MRLVLLLAVAALASAQLPSVDVLYSTLTYLVYEDGAVQPVYNASFTVLVPGVALSGGLSLEGFENYVEGLVEGGYTLSGGFTGDFNATGSLDLGIDWRGEYANGAGAFDMRIDVRVRNATQTTPIAAKVSGEVGNMTVDFRLDLYLPAGLALGAGGPPSFPTVDEINRNLTRAGLDYIRVKSIGASMNETTVTVTVEGSIDVERAAERAREAGADEGSVGALRELAGGRYELNSKGFVAFRVAVDRGRVDIGGEGQWRVAGDVNRSDVLGIRAAGAIAALVQDAVFKLMSLLGNATMPPPMVPGMAAEQTPLVRTPPSNASLKLLVTAAPGDNGTLIAVNVTYVGHRVTPLNRTGDPARDAEEALAYAAMDYMNAANTISSIAFMLPGLGRLVPDTVELRPASPRVRIGQETVRPTELPTVKVEVSPEPATPTAAPTQPARPAEAATPQPAPSLGVPLIAIAAVVAVAAAAVALALRRRAKHA